jgi:acyl-CoA thioesterase I
MPPAYLIHYTYMKRALIGIFCVGVVVGLSTLFWKKEQITNYPPTSSTIVAFGDSLVEGKGATMGNDFVSVLERSVGRPILNHGVSGDTTADALMRLDAVIAEKPGIVLLLLGGNDYLRRVPEETTRKNFVTIIEALHHAGAVVVLLGVRGGLLQDTRESLYEDLAKEYHLVYVPDVLDGIFGRSALMADGIHPNDAGYAIMSDRIYMVLQSHHLPYEVE